MDELHALLTAKAEYIHVLLNPVPTHVLPFGVLALLLGMLLKNREACIIGLVIIFISAAIAWPVAELGEKAYDRIAARTDDPGQAWLDEHSHRAAQLIYVFYVAAFVSLFALVAMLRKHASEKLLVRLTLVVSLAAAGIGGHIAFAGGKVSHKEFRTTPAPTDSGSAKEPGTARDAD
ncbi:MAG: hypothetical protein U0136_03925 [Bdellovibrionota bacterium]